MNYKANRPKWTQEQWREWLMKFIDDEEPGGLMACSPEIYEQLMRGIPTEKENQDGQPKAE